MSFTGPSVPLGINCRGSFFCMAMDLRNVTGRMLDLTNNIQTHAIYATGAHIACLGTEEALSGHVGAFCLFMQGPHAHQIVHPITDDHFTGIEGSLVKQKTLELYDHGCRACGSVPISNDNDPTEKGILTINFVYNAAGCTGSRLCIPTIAESDRVHDANITAQEPINPIAKVVDATANGSQPCASSPGDPVVADARGVPMEDCDSSGEPPDPSSTSTAVVGNNSTFESAKDNNNNTGASTESAPSFHEIATTAALLESQMTNMTSAVTVPSSVAPAPTTMISSVLSSILGTVVPSGRPYLGGH